jgi:hypothetical protein
MGLTDILKDSRDYVTKKVTGFTPTEIVALTKSKPDSQSVIKQVVQRQLHRTKQDIQTWRDALDSAERDISPDRTELVRGYKDVLIDNHLSSQIESRKNKVLGSRFWIENAKGEKQDQYTKLFTAEWFYTFLGLAMDEEYYGYEVIEFGPIENDEFTWVKKIREEFVVPEQGVVKKQIGLNAHNSTSTDVVDYTRPPYSNWTVALGNTTNLGLLMKLAPLAIWKKNVFSAWSERAELFGQPIRIGKTNLRDDARRLNMEAMMVNIGSAASATLDLTDIVEFIESNNTDAHNVYNELIERCNSEMSKLIVGGTATTDEKSYVGSAEVHERNAQSYTGKDKRKLKYFIENHLFALMRRHRLLPQDAELYFSWDMEEQLSKVEKLDVITKLAAAGFVVEDREVEEEYGVKLQGTPDLDPEKEQEGDSPVTEVEALYKPYITAQSKVDE